MGSSEGRKGVVNEGLGERESVPAIVRGVTSGTIAVRKCGLTGASFLVQNRFIHTMSKCEVASLDSYNLIYKPMRISS